MSTASPFDPSRMNANSGYMAGARDRSHLMDQYPYPSPGAPDGSHDSVTYDGPDGIVVVERLPKDEPWPGPLDNQTAENRAERYRKRLKNREAAIAAGRLAFNDREEAPVAPVSRIKPSPLPGPTPHKRQSQTPNAPAPPEVKRPPRPEPEPDVERPKAERREAGPLRFKFGSDTLAKPKMSNVKYVDASRTHVEITKHGNPEDNEDTCYTDPRSASVGVFDGVGGYGRAREASQTASGVMQEVFRSQGRPQLDRFLTEEDDRRRSGGAEGPQTQRAKQNMRQALNIARQEVDKLGVGATTASVVHVAESPCITRDGKETRLVPIVVGHVGDSKVFVLSQSMLPNGKTERKISVLTRDQGDGGNQLSNCIGRGHDNTQDSVSIFIVGRGSRILVCSDGITGDDASDHVSPREILAAAASPDPNQAARDLIKYAGYDNYRGTVFHPDDPKRVLYHRRGKWDDKAVAIIDIE